MLFVSNFNNFFELNQDIQLRGTGAVCIPRQITELTKNGRGMPSDFMEFNVTWDNRLLYDTLRIDVGTVAIIMKPRTTLFCICDVM